MNSTDRKLAAWDKVFALSETRAADLLAEACKIINLPLAITEDAKHVYLSYADLVKTGRSVHGPRNLAQTIARWRKEPCYLGINVGGRNYPDVWLALAFFAAVPPYRATSATEEYDQDKQDRMYTFLQNALGVNDAPEVEAPEKERGVVSIDAINTPTPEEVWGMGSKERLQFRLGLFARIPREQADQILINACEGTPLTVHYDKDVGAYCTHKALRAVAMSVTGPRDYFTKGKQEFTPIPLPDGTPVFVAQQMLPYLTRTTFRGASPANKALFTMIRSRIAEALHIDVKVFLHPGGFKAQATEAPEIKTQATEAPVIEALVMPPVASGTWDRVSTTIKERMDFLLKQKQIADAHGIPWGFVIQGVR